MCILSEGSLTGTRISPWLSQSEPVIPSHSLREGLWSSPLSWGRTCDPVPFPEGEPVIQIPSPEGNPVIQSPTLRENMWSSLFPWGRTCDQASSPRDDLASVRELRRNTCNTSIVSCLQKLCRYFISSVEGLFLAYPVYIQTRWRPPSEHSVNEACIHWPGEWSGRTTQMW